MYGWIWRVLPFGVPGKIIGSLLLASAVAALLWYVVFPWADPFLEETLLPWNEGQLEGDFVPGDSGPASDQPPTNPPPTTGPGGELPEGSGE